MAIVIILIGTILLIGILIGVLALALSIQEEPDRRENEAEPFQPELSRYTVPEREAVPEVGLETEPVAHPQPSWHEPVATQAAKSL